MNEDAQPDLDTRQRRDRALASRPRYGPRQAAAVSDLVKAWMRSPEMQRLRRNSHLAAALAEVLSDAERTRIRAVRWSGGALTLAVRGSPLLAELRQFRYQALIDACIRHGTGISRIQLVPEREIKHAKVNDNSSGA